LKVRGQRSKINEEINASDRDWSTVMIGGTWAEETRGFSGKSVGEILRRRGVLAASEIMEEQFFSDAAGTPRQRSNPGELICDILEADGCKTGAFFFGMSEENLAKIYSRPWIVPGSDASLRAPWGPLGKDHPHPRAYGTMPEFYRRVRTLGFSREETVARMTSVPAKRFGIRGRGVLEKGAFADLVIWDEARFKSMATYEKPHQFSEGVSLVMVNGTVPYRDGKFTGERGGRFLER